MNFERKKEAKKFLNKMKRNKRISREKLRGNRLKKKKKKKKKKKRVKNYKRKLHTDAYEMKDFIPSFSNEAIGI